MVPGSYSGQKQLLKVVISWHNGSKFKVNLKYKTFNRKEFFFFFFVVYFRCVCFPYLQDQANIVPGSTATLWPHFYFILSAQSSNRINIPCCHLNLFSAINIVCACTHAHVCSCSQVWTYPCVCRRRCVGMHLEIRRHSSEIVPLLQSWCDSSFLCGFWDWTQASCLCSKRFIYWDIAPVPINAVFEVVPWSALFSLHDTPAIPYISFRFLILLHLPWFSVGF